MEPHPFYIADANQRADLIAFIRGLDETTKSSLDEVSGGPVTGRGPSDV
jgi:hypothetical protein